MPLNDESEMPFGQYQGKKLIDVPAAYLLSLYDEGKAPAGLKAYIKDNMYVLRAEMKRASTTRVAQCSPRRRR